MRWQPVRNRRLAVSKRGGNNASQAIASEATDITAGSADTVKYQSDRAQDLADSRGRIDPLMAANNLTALLFANSGRAGIGAKAGYPSVSVPAGYTT